MLDVGCGTGLLLRLLAERCPDIEQLAGIDAAEGMISVANATEHPRQAPPSRRYPVRPL
ncbi:MAG: class I SAM-dependent methyltransferase [Acidimicrobiales bacterium]